MENHLTKCISVSVTEVDGVDPDDPSETDKVDTKVVENDVMDPPLLVVSVLDSAKDPSSLNSETCTQNKQHTFDKCGKTFKYLKNMKVHRSTHYETLSFSCNICDKIFKLQPSLTRHEKIKHTSFKISTGNGTFLLTNNNIQTKQNDTTCNICPK